MKLITWNIQWSRGVDGIVDPRRIVDDAQKFADFDVVCLQEVAANFPALAGSKGEDQFEIMAGLLPGYTAISAVAVDVAAPEGGRRHFGNMLLSRYPVLRVLRHQLPWPVDADVISMPRVLLEATLYTPLGPIRVMNTHLEYHSAGQRVQQVEAIRQLYADGCLRDAGKLVAEPTGSPYDTVAAGIGTILMGDFNFRPEDPLHARLQQPFPESFVPRLLDTWQHLHGELQRPPNAGLYDREQWPEPFACNFVLASEDLMPRVRGLALDRTTRSSDHQPQCLELA